MYRKILQCSGKLKEAESLVLESRAIATEEVDEIAVALSLRLRGYLLNLSGDYGQGQGELLGALALFQKHELAHPQFYVYTNMAWGYLLQLKPDLAMQVLDSAQAIGWKFQYTRDISRLQFLRGKALRLLAQYDEAIVVLRDAASLCRQVSLVEFEANISIELARTLLGSGKDDFSNEVWILLRGALTVSRSSGYRIQEADTHLALAYAAVTLNMAFNEDVADPELSPEYLATAIREATLAMSIAAGDIDGYTYRRVYDDAEALLAQLDRAGVVSKETANENVARQGSMIAVEGQKDPMFSTISLDRDRRFAVALSFPGEIRHRVSMIANRLKVRFANGKVFYDRDYEAELARPNLDLFLQGIYHDHAELVVVFVCADYDRKDWCGLEWRAIRDLIMHRADNIMFLRCDDAEVSGMFSIDGYIDIRERLDDDVAELIFRRWQGQATSPKM